MKRCGKKGKTDGRASSVREPFLFSPGYPLRRPVSQAAAQSLHGL